MTANKQNAANPSNGGGGGGGGGGGSGGGVVTPSSPEKPIKKVKRGVGVAKLELELKRLKEQQRLRMEEQQRNSNALNSSTSLNNLSPIHSSSLPVDAIPNHPHNNVPSFRLPSQTSSNPIFGTQPPPFSPGIHNNFHWDSPYEHMNPPHVNMNDYPMIFLPFSPNNIMPRAPHVEPQLPTNILPSAESAEVHALPLPRREVVYERQQPTPLINVSSSTVLNSPIEPPSNQNFLSNYSPDGHEKRAGSKRKCRYKDKVPPRVVPPISRSNELTLFETGEARIDFNPTIPIYSDVDPLTRTMPIPSNSKMEETNEDVRSLWQGGTSLTPNIRNSSPADQNTYNSEVGDKLDLDLKL